MNARDRCHVLGNSNEHMPPDNAIDRIAAKLNTTPEQVLFYLSRFNEGPVAGIVRALYIDRIETFVTESVRKLRKLPPEETRYTQGLADGLELAITQINDQTLTSPIEEPNRTL